MNLGRDSLSAYPSFASLTRMGVSVAYRGLCGLVYMDLKRVDCYLQTVRSLAADSRVEVRRVELKLEAKTNVQQSYCSATISLVLGLALTVCLYYLSILHGFDLSLMILSKAKRKPQKSESKNLTSIQDMLPYWWKMFFKQNIPKRQKR